MTRHSLGPVVQWTFRSLTAVLVLAAATPAGSELRLSDPTSEVYYELALLAGEEIQIEGGVSIAGDVASNGDLDLKKDAVIEGDVTVVGQAKVQGTITGTLAEGAAPRSLPELASEADLRAWADRVLDGDQTFEDERVDDVVFVDGTVRIRGGVQGEGTIIATRDIRLDTVGGGAPAPPEAGTRLSLIALDDVRVAQDWQLRGVLRAGRDVDLEKDLTLDGVLVAGRKIHVKKDSVLTFVDFDQTPPTITPVAPVPGSVVGDPRPEIVVGLADELSGLDLASIAFFLDGAAVSPAVGEVAADDAAATLRFTPAEPLADGLHEVEVSVADHSGNVATGSFAFTVDTAAPVLVIVDPADGSVVLADPAPDGSTAVSIVVDFSDPIAGVDPASLAVTVDGAAVTPCEIRDSGATADGATCGPAILLSGFHTIEATVRDRAGNTAFATATFRLVADQVPPTITLVEPSEPLVVNDPAPTLVFELADDRTGVDPDSFFVAYDGVAITADCLVGPTSATCSPHPMGSKRHTVEVRVADQVGNLATASFEFEVLLDEAPPFLTILTPEEGDLLVRDAPAVELEFGDADSAVVLESLSLTVDGADVTASCIADVGLAFCSPPIGGGAHVLVASIADRAGNEATAERRFNLVLDVEPPSLSVVAPADGTGVFSSPEDGLEVLLAYGDATAGVDLGSLSLLLDGAELAADCVVDDAAAECLAVGLGSGSHVVQATVADRVGNVATASAAFTLTIDAEAPTVTVTAPAESFLLGVETIDVAVVFADAGSGVDPAAARVRLGSRDLTPGCSVDPAGAVCTGVAVAPGSQAVLAEVADRAGNRATARFEFRVEPQDETPPEIAVTAPAEPLVRRDGFQEITLVYADGSAGVDPATLVVRVDGDDITAGCQVAADSAVCPPPALTAGAHVIEAEVRDRAGNLGEVRHDFALSLALDVAVTSPENGFLTREAEIEIEGTVDPLAQTIVIGDVAGVVDGGTFVVQGVDLHEGSNSLTAVARGPDGEIGTATVTVVRDTTPPRVTIRTPGDGFVTTSSPIAVAGEIVDPTSSSADMAPPEVFVNDVPAELEGRAFLARDVLLVPGENLVEVAVVDNAGNEGRATVRVVYHADVLQRLEAVLGQGQTGTVGETLSQPLTVRLADFTGTPLPGRPVTFTVSRGGGLVAAYPDEGKQVTVETDGQGLAQAQFTLGTRSGSGLHEVTATSAGFPGGVVFCATAEPTAPRRIVRIPGDDPVGPLVGPAGGPAPKPFVVQVFDDFGNPAVGVEVTFEAVAGGGAVEGSPVHVAVTDVDGRASAALTLGPAPGVNNNVFEARFEGLEELPAATVLSGVATGPEELTTVSGIVTDARDEPLAGATVHISGTTLETFSGEDGGFTLAGVPVGTIHLEVDGTTATREGPWPHLAFRFTTLPGVDNTLGMPIRLPRLDPESEAVVGGAEDVTLKLAGVPGAEITVFAGSATFADGSKVGTMSFSQVPGDKVPMVAPMGSNFMLAWTIQPAGVHFDPPARISIPNLGAAPGAVVDIFSFDHDLAEFVPVGTGSVTADGERVVSDPGFGVIKAGWHGCVPPPPPKTNACNAKIEGVVPSANGIDTEAFVVKDQEVVFRAKVEGRCSRPEVRWTFGDGDSGAGEVTSHAYDRLGDFTVNVTAQCESCPPGGSASRSMRVRVVEFGLEMQELPEEDEEGPNEEEPGVVLVSNVDDDDRDQTPDFEQDGKVEDENDLEPLRIQLDSGVREGEVRLEARGGAGKLRIFEEADRGEEIELPKTWDLAEERPPATVHVEGVGSSDEVQDIELRLTYRQKPSSEPVEDRIVVTALELDFDVLPAEEFPLLVTHPDFGLVTSVLYRDFDESNEVEFMPVDEGAEIVWEVVEGSPSLSTTMSTTDQAGGAVVEIAPPGAVDDVVQVEGRLKKFRFEGAPEGVEDIETDLAFRTAEIPVSAGIPARIELAALSPPEATYPADGRASLLVEAKLFDALDNPVASGTPVDWILDRNHQGFRSVANTTTGNTARADLRAPILPLDQTLTVRAGEAVATLAIDVEPIAGTLTAGADELDLAGSEGLEMTVSTNATEQAQVQWQTSNGSIPPTTFVDPDGLSTVTLSPEGGCPGPVVVTATVGGKMFFWEGKFVSSNDVWMEVERRYLVSTKDEDGFTSHTRPDGTTTTAPYFAGTDVTLHAPPIGTEAVLFFPGQQVLDGYDFDSPTGGGLSPIELDGAVFSDGLDLGGLSFAEGTSARIPAIPEHELGTGYGLSFALLPGGPGQVIAKDGAFSISVGADNRVVATVTTTAGSGLVASSEPVEAGVWNLITLEGAPGALRLVVNGKSEKRLITGAPINNTSPIVLGGGFSGSLDELTLYDAQQEVPFEVVGLKAGRRTPINLDGTATFRLLSRGDFPIEKYEVREYAFEAVTFNPGNMARGVAEAERLAAKNAGGESSAAASVFFTSDETWAELGDVVKGFFGQDTETAAGTLASVVGGMLVVGDIGAIGKNVGRIFGWVDGDPNYPELILSAFGIFTTLGGPLDAPVSAARSLVAKIGNSPLADILANRIRRFVRTGSLPSAAETRLLRQLDESSELGDAVSLLARTDDAWEGIVRFCRFAGSSALVSAGASQKNVLVHTEMLRLAARFGTDPNFGPGVAQAMELMIRGIPERGAQRLFEIAADDLPAAVNSLAKVFKASDGVEPTVLAQILANRVSNVITDSYGAARFFDDLSQVAGVPGFERLVRNMDSLSRNAAGFRYELEVAAFLQRNDFVVQSLGEHVLPEGFKNFSDIDVIARLGSKGIAFNVKRTASALERYGVDKMRRWILATLDKPGVTEVRLTLPDNVPQKFQDLVRDLSQSLAGTGKTVTIQSPVIPTR